MSSNKDQNISTRLLHADDEYAEAPIGPTIAVSSTYRYPEITWDEWKSVNRDWDAFKPERHIYSRYTANTSTRAEKILGDIHGDYALIYSSGLSAGFSALIHLAPKRIAISGGYFGFHETINIYRKIIPSVQMIDLDDEYQPGDIAWVETPLNPTGEVRDLSYYANKVQAVGGKLAVDATFAPPPLQDPFKWGADLIMHSASKYLGGHSDLLAGVLVVKTEQEWRDLWHTRTYLGNNAGSLDSWLLLRSLRTFSLRITCQSSNATKLAQWLNQIAQTSKGKSFEGVPGGIIKKVWHGSLQDKSRFDPAKQHTGGYSPTFSILMDDPIIATKLPDALKLFIHAGSLGRVQTSIEQRRHSDLTSDLRLLRISVGIDDVEDMKEDFRQGIHQVLKAKAKL